jgi:flagellar hook-associated protein 2
MATLGFAGIASGIDTESLIRATSAASRQSRVTPLQQRVQELTDTNDALGTLTTRLTRLRTQVNKFNTLSGGPLEKNASTSDEAVLTAAAGRGTPSGSYEVTVSQIAKNGVFSFGDRWSSTSSVINAAIDNSASAESRTVSIAVGLGSSQETIDLELSNTTTPAELVASFNDRSSKAVATLVNVGTAAIPSYALSVTAISEGTQDGTVALVNPTGSELLKGTAALQSGTTQSAADAQFSISGISGTITRPSNTVTDVVRGLSLNLRSLGDSTVTVRDNVTGSTQLMSDFVDRLNEIITFVNEGNQVTQEESKQEKVNTFGPLTKTSVDEGIISALRTAVSSTQAPSGSAVRVFADLGIATQRDGTLSFDATKFRAAVTSEPSSVETLLKTFADQIGLTGGTIDNYTRFNGLIDGVENGNKLSIDNSNKRISEAEKVITQAEDQARARFARFESLMGNLQNQQSRLASALSSIGR